MKLSEEKQITKKYYDQKAREWAISHSRLAYRIGEFNEFRKLLPTGKIIDLGCGTGHYARPFTESGYSYTGIDLSDGMLAEARRGFYDGDFRQMDLSHLDFEDDSFEGIWSLAAYLHLPKNQINHAISEAYRILKPGGLGFISVKKGSAEKYIGEDSEKRYWSFYGIRQFSKILTENGFEVIKSWEDKRQYNPPKDVTVFLCYFIRKPKATS